MGRKLTLPEAADYVRLYPKTIYNLTSRKLIPHFKTRGRLRFDQDELDEWQEQFRVRVVPESSTRTRNS